MIDHAAAAQFLETFSALSEGGPGVTRLAYTALERDAHAVFTAHMERLGLSVQTDAVGNTIAVLPASDRAQASAIGTGSHLDSVPQGGSYDGVAGVVAAMLVAASAIGSARPRRRPWRFVAFAAEEGARFAQACNGSRVAAGLTGAEDLERLTDSTGRRMFDAMVECGLEPARAASAAWKEDDWFAFVELHIEQGTRLESTSTDVGIVTIISGSTRMKVTITGQASHSGGTPMEDRKDALAAASECVLRCESVANESRNPETRVTVGSLVVEPGAITTVPGRTTFFVDVRDEDALRQRRVATELAADFVLLCERRSVSVEIEPLADTPPVPLPPSIAAILSEAAVAAGASHRRMSSGASHDSQQINRITPAGLIFVPSRGGISHAPEEFSSLSQIATGTEVLLEALYLLDAQ